jgi:hypothetical protein
MAVGYIGPNAMYRFQKRKGSYLVEEDTDLLWDPPKVAKGSNVVTKERVCLPQLPYTRLQHPELPVS